jgi:hypothetical protein
MPDDDDRPRDASSAADGGWADDGLTVDWRGVVAPDDIRELAADIKAYRREQRGIRREHAMRRLTMRLGMRPLSLVAIVLVLVAAVATMVAVVMPNSSRALRAAPLAKTTASVTSNGLLPDVTLRGIDRKTVQSRSLRPGLFALAPSPCDCKTQLRLAAAAAHAKHLQLVVVAPSGNDPELLAQSGTFGPGVSTLLYDPANELRNGPIHAVGLTLVAVAADGTVKAIQKSVTTATVNQIQKPLSLVLTAAESTG